VCPLTSHGRIVGVQVGYLDPDGQKSTIDPKRRRFMLEKAYDAVFELPYAGENKDVIVAEASKMRSRFGVGAAAAAASWASPALARCNT
jgi:hypothetical protein